MKSANYKDLIDQLGLFDHCTNFNSFDKDDLYSADVISAHEEFIRSFSEILQNDGKYGPLDSARLATTMMEDLFSLCFKPQAIVRDAGKVDPALWANHFVTTSIADLSNFNMLHSTCQMDLFSSLIAMSHLKQPVVDVFKEYFKQAGKAEKEKETAGKGKMLTEEEALAHLKKLLAMHKEAAAAAKAKMHNVMYSAVTKSLNEIQGVRSAIQQFGVFVGDASRIPLAGKRMLVDRLKKSEKLLKIINMFGRMLSQWTYMANKSVRTTEMDDYHVIHSNDVLRALSNDKLLFSHPLLEKIGKLKQAEEELMSLDFMQTDNRKKKQRGPVIIMDDESGSMSGEPEVWAKAISLALIEITRRQKRACAIYHFSGGGIEEIPEFIMRKGETGSIERLNELLDFMEMFMNGGTLFEPPLTKGRKFIDSNDDEFSKADIVFVTDGDSVVTPEWTEDFNKWRAEKNIKVLSILINSYGGSDTMLKKFSNQVLTLNDIHNQEDMATATVFQQFL